MTLRLTIPLSDIGTNDATIAGGKGASLGELMRAGAPVPVGFVVTSAAFDRFMAGEHKALVDAVLERLDADAITVDQAASEIAAHLSQVPVPPAVMAAVNQAVFELSVDRVSVRSSATCEDSGTTAWAGQLDTYLNVGPADIVARLRDCWLSMFSQPALSYGATHGYGAAQFSVAVVIQTMVASDISGIGFSVHPVTQEPNIMLIEACLGLGEAIVSGRIMPDQYIVERGSHDIMEALIGRQREGLFMQPGGTAATWQPLEDDGAQRKLTDAQVIEYARLLTRIADHYGYPVDTEWALENNQFQVLQARPITTLAEEYDQPIIQLADDWQLVVRRPMSLLEVSIWAHWQDSEHASKMIGIVENRAMSIQDDAGMALDFLPAPALVAAMAHIEALYQHERPQLIAMLQHGQTIYHDARQRIARGISAFQGIDDVIDFCTDAAQFTTMLPVATLKYYEQHELNDPEVRILAEQLRADTLYPHIERHIADPMVASMTTAIGFSEPEVAPLVTTWRELQQEHIDRDLLETRLEAVRAGKRFVFQSIDGEDSVRFVAQTGYLLMRLAKQYEAVSAEDMTADKLRGQAAWPGLYRGRARVILSPDAVGQTIEDGEVLISIQSSPALMPLLRRCGALVTDEGGIACHAAIIARELRKPTLIGTGRATAVIHTGDLIEIDTYNQVVRILERAGADS